MDPSGSFTRWCSEATLVGGDALDGTWSLDCSFPRYSQEGQWLLYQLSDSAGNAVPWGAAELAIAGFPNAVALTSTPSDVTPTTISALSFAPTFIDTFQSPPRT